MMIKWFTASAFVMFMIPALLSQDNLDNGSYFQTRLVDSPFNLHIYEQRPIYKETNFIIALDIDSVYSNGDSLVTTIHFWINKLDSNKYTLSLLNRWKKDSVVHDKNYYEPGDLIAKTNDKYSMKDAIKINTSQGILINEITPCGFIEQYGIFFLKD